jgi:signal transduction histidine kinase
MLSTVKLYFEWLAETSESDKRENIVKTGIQNINDAIQAVREISNSLSPRVLDGMGLIPAMKYLIHQLNETQKIEIYITYDIERRYRPQLEVTLYRIFSELINNTIKYADAQTITIEVKHNLDNERIFAIYKDDGKGFNLEDISIINKGMGLQNMKQRVETLNGKITFNTDSGKPLTVNIELPINDIIQ